MNFVVSLSQSQHTRLKEVNYHLTALKVKIKSLSDEYAVSLPQNRFVVLSLTPVAKINSNDDLKDSLKETVLISDIRLQMRRD